MCYSYGALGRGQAGLSSVARPQGTAWRRKRPDKGTVSAELGSAAPSSSRHLSVRTLPGLRSPRGEWHTRWEPDFVAFLGATFSEWSCPSLG